MNASRAIMSQASVSRSERESSADLPFGRLSLNRERLLKRLLPERENSLSVFPVVFLLREESFRSFATCTGEGNTRRVCSRREDRLGGNFVISVG